MAMMHGQDKKEMNGESNLFYGHDHGVCACVNKEISKTYKNSRSVVEIKNRLENAVCRNG